MPKVYKSLYPDPPEVDLATNAESIFSGRPDQAGWNGYKVYLEGDTGREITYEAFWEKVNDARTALAQGLSSPAPDIVGIMGDNSIDYSTLVHALLGTAVPFSPVSSYSTKFELAHILKLLTPTSMFVHPRHLSLVLSVAKDIGLSSERIFVFEGRVPGKQSLDELIEQVRLTRTAPVGIRTVSKDSLAYLLFSSGTTGLPKAVMTTHENVVYGMSQSFTAAKLAAEGYQAPPTIRPEGIPASLAFLPLYHSYGLQAHIFRPFIAPTTQVIMKKWSVERALELIRMYRITELFLVPSAVHQLLRHPTIKNVDLSLIQSVSCGAAYLPPELAHKLTSLMTAPGARLAEGYAMSETTVAILWLPAPVLFADKLKPPAKSPIGILMPGEEARIVREDGTDASSGEVGELWLKGKNISPGYYRNPEATRDTFVEGGVWLHTGDRFWTDGQYFYFVDRAKDTLKVSGTQVSPVEIETVLRGHPDGLAEDVSVAGVSGGRTSDELVPRAWVVPCSFGKKLREEEARRRLEDWSREHLSRVKWLRGGIEFISQIPKSPTGKVLRRVLQDNYETRKRQLGMPKL